MVILIASFIEAIILDFFQCYFINKPLCAYDYVYDDRDNLRGKIDLKDILSASTKEEFITDVAQRAAKVAIRGKFKTTLSNLEKITKMTLPTEISEALLSMVELRNKIVHELMDVAIPDNEINQDFGRVVQLIFELAAIAQRNGIEIKLPLKLPEKK
jgi:uncharacterized protein YutE (UPF0331/DUF86 family)